MVDCFFWASSTTSLIGTLLPSGKGFFRPISMMWYEPGLSETDCPAGSGSAAMARIFITSPSIFISWTSTVPATGELPPTSLLSCVAVRLPNMPVAC